MKRRVKSANLRLENLEDRNLMAGDVAVHVLGGNLFLVGDAEANGVELSSTAVEGQYIIEGIDVGGDATTVDGESTPLVVDGVDRSVFVRMGSGDDLLRTTQLDVRGSMHVHMGKGDDSVHIGDVEADAAVVEVGRALNVSLGTGDDRAGIANTKARWLRTSGGAGNDEIRVRDSAARRGLRIAAGSGDDDVRVNDVTSRHIAIRTGAGGDSVRVVDSKANRIGVHLGKGDDQLAINGTEARRVRLGGGDGTDSLVTDLALEDIYVRGFEGL